MKFTTNKPRVNAFCNAYGIPCKNASGILTVNTTIKALRSNPLYLTGLNFSGNKKLKNTKEVKYIIWNIPAVRTCPYATELCKGNCYAVKAEIVYPNVIKCRTRNFDVSREDNFTERMIYTIGVELYFSKRYTRVSEIRFRIHESGDFYNQKYTNAWIEVINYFKRDTRLVFDCYTKSLPYFENVNVRAMKNFAFKASVWADTSDKMLQIIRAKKYAVYTADTKENVEKTLQENKNAKLCRCEDCGNCGLCAHCNFRDLILCVIH